MPMSQLVDVAKELDRISKELEKARKNLEENTYPAYSLAEAKAIQEADPDALWFPTVTEALPAIRAAFTAGTAVLVKASHAMHFTDIVKDLEATE